MPNINVWSKVAVAVQSALSAAQVISAISKANPGVVTYVGADPANGDYVLLTVEGMHQVNDRVFRVANVNAGGNTFELEGENTTDFDTFGSGEFEIVTFGTTLATLVDIAASGGEFAFEDTSTIHSDEMTQIPVASQPMAYNFSSLWDPADSGMAALKSASDARSPRCVRFTFTTGAKLVFNGYVACKNAPTGAARAKAVTPVVFTLNKSPTAYAS